MNLPSFRFPKRFWIFNGFMLWGAGLAYIIGTSAVGLGSAIRHEGSGIVLYGEDGERPERVSESQYKRHEYTMNGMMLALGVGLWVVVAKAARDEVAKSDATKNVLLK